MSRGQLYINAMQQPSYGGYAPPSQPVPGSMSNPFGGNPTGGAGGGAPMRSPFGNSAPPATSAFGGPPPAAGPPPSAPFAGGPAMAPPPTASSLAAQKAAEQAPTGPPQAFATAASLNNTVGGFGGQTAPSMFQSAAPPPSGQPGCQGASLGQPGFQGAGGSGGNPRLATLVNDIELFNPPPHFVRGTVSKFPNSVSTKQKAGLPLGVVLQPLAPTPSDMEPVPSVTFGGVGSIVRCKDCKAYMNPFVNWDSSGHRWTCNVCGTSQSPPAAYHNPVDANGKRSDRFERHELSKGVVEYIASDEYMSRPPQAPVFMFLIDVSYAAVVTGMLDTVVSGIKEAIQTRCLPGGTRTMVGIMTYDTSLHFYNLNPNLSQPQVFVVADLEDMFLPLPGDMLVNLCDCESVILNLLDSLPQLYSETKLNETCMVSAIKGASMAMKHIGGKLMVFASCIASIGELALKSTRDNQSILGTDREVELLRPVGDGFRQLAFELTKAQISVELFACPQAYVDLASISMLAKHTAGDVRYYPQFHIHHAGMKLKSELMHVLSRYMGWEAVMRIRVSQGWKITKFFGHHFIKGADLLVVPNCHADQTFGISIQAEDNVTPDPVLFVQSALLYTNSDGERRIRVHTWAATTTGNHNDIVLSADVQATISLLSQITIDGMLNATIKQGREKLQAQCQQIVQVGNACPAAEAMQFLPLYILGMLKSAAFRGSNDVSADLRMHLWMRLESLSVSQTAAYFYPRMLALHNLGEGVGLPDEHGSIVLPDMLNLTSESMTQDGIFLLEDGESMFMWVGNSVDGSLLQSVFGVPSFDQLDTNSAEANLFLQQDPLAQRIGAIIQHVRSERLVPYMQLHIVRQGEQPKEGRFFASLIEDKTVGFGQTYTGFLQSLGYRPQNQSPGGHMGVVSDGASPAAGSFAQPMGAGASYVGSGAPPMGGGAPPMGSGAPPMGGGGPPMGFGGSPMGGGAPSMGTAPPMGMAPPTGMRG
eukprot:TRINITY_DN74368_c0_g1_i1.p1 TRINITY_DN74368_c0_g1~~TRINITY_DN74368_c0_g1_i1.p1  ORF type:complete len:988 (+),score=151.21 TRINITY_DN74368_c0_g1_i1:40-3003(+)